MSPFLRFVWHCSQGLSVILSAISFDIVQPNVCLLTYKKETYLTQNIMPNLVCVMYHSND